jgi:hypothetical protein
MNSVLSSLADVCSILGFLFTVVVLLKLRGIHRSFLAQARLPDLQKKIRGHRSALAKLLNDFPATASEIEAEIRKCHANLRNLQPKLPRAHAASVKPLVAATAQLSQSSTVPDKEQVRKIYLALVLLEGELDNLSEDMKWRARE